MAYDDAENRAETGQSAMPNNMPNSMPDSAQKAQNEVQKITDPALKEKCQRLLEVITTHKMNALAAKRLDKMMGEEVL